MSNLDFVQAHGANFNHINAVGVSARNAQFDGSSMLGSNWKDSDMSGASLRNTVIDASTKFGNIAGADITGMQRQEADGSRTPVTHTMLANEHGASGNGHNVAAESIQKDAQNNQPANEKGGALGAGSMQDALQGLSKLAGGEHISAANSGQLPTPDTPADARQAALAAKGSDSPTLH